MGAPETVDVFVSFSVVVTVVGDWVTVEVFVSFCVVVRVRFCDCVLVTVAGA